MRFLVTYLLAGIALAVLFAVPFVFLPLAGLVATEHGPGAGLLALGGALLLGGGAFRAFARLVDARTGEPAEGGPRAPADRVFCLRCGAAAAPDGVVCARCGGTRFGLAAPPGPAHPGVPAPATGLGNLMARAGQAGPAAAGRLLAAARARTRRRPRPVYVRVVRGRCDPNRLAELRHLADGTLLPALRRRPGLLGWYGGGDPSAGTLLSVSLWTTAEAARTADDPRAVVGPPGDRPTFEGLGARFEPPEVYEAILRV